MKRYLFFVVFFIISAFILPLCVFFIMQFQDNLNQKQNEKKPSGQDISVYFSDEKATHVMNIEEYLTGVVCAEMPASFEKEALKAQAVAARSYAVYRIENQSADHPEAAVCTDFAHCKAYKKIENAQKDWGKDSEKYTEKIRQAVSETEGEILTYNGEVALAVFHSQSGGGRTENSSDVWGGDVPYLVSVESHGEENAPNFYSSAVFSFEEFKEKILSQNAQAKLSTPQDIGECEISEGGSVKSITIGGVDFTGREIRTLFNLRSSCFKVFADEGSVRFEVTGYGHGVGMSQYGANTMAKEGFDYKKILTHYYSGTEIEGV